MELKQNKSLEVGKPLSIGLSTPNFNLPTSLTGTLGSNVGKATFQKNPSFLSTVGKGLSSNLSGIGKAGGISGVMGLATGVNNLFNATGNQSQQQMQRGDAIVDTVSAGLSFLPGFGQAAGAALSLVNKFGAGLVKQPAAMKNYTTNQNVMANSASFGGVAAGATDAEATRDSFNKSGLFGRLIGKNKSTQNRFNKATAQQGATQGVLTTNQTALDNSASSADMFTTQNLNNQAGLSNQLFGRGGIRFGQKGMKIMSFDAFTKHYDKNPKDSLYNIKGAYDIYKSNPKKFEDPEMGIASKEQDGWHFSSVDPHTNVFLKKKNHPTIHKEIEWYNSEGGASFRKDFKLDSTQNYFKYVPRVNKNKKGGVLLKSAILNKIKQSAIRELQNDNFPEIEPLLPEITEDVDTIAKHANGGSIQNVIVDGKLHSRKHTIKDNDEFNDAKITTKGVPVIVREDGGTIDQMAEVEREELILHKELTSKLEALYEKGDEESMIEAGRLLSIELTENVKDNTDVISKIEADEENKDRD